MCVICRNIICPSNCPNFDEGIPRSGSETEIVDGNEPVGECSACGKELYSGDVALLLEDVVLCETCTAEAMVRLSSEQNNFNR